VTGLILLDARPTQTCMARRLPGRCHAALSRLLIAFAKRLSRDGYLVLDAVVVEKAFAKRLPWAA
jgi:hypothetical protein